LPIPPWRGVICGSALLRRVAGTAAATKQAAAPEGGCARESHPSIRCLTPFGTYSGCFLDGGSLRSAPTQDAFSTVGHSVRHLLRILSRRWVTAFGTYSGCFLDGGSLRSAPTQDAFSTVGHCVRHLLRMLSRRWVTAFGTYSGCFLDGASLRSTAVVQRARHAFSRARREAAEARPREHAE
jgi:hypothetical protein